MRFLFLLISLALLLFGMIILLLILKESVLGIFRFIGMLGRLAVRLVYLLFRGIGRTVSAGASLMRPAMRKAVASVAAAYQFAADGLGRGVRRAAPRLAPHVERVQARAAGIMQKSWSGKDVLIIVLATLVAAPMITVLFVALVPVLVVVGAIAVLQAMFGSAEEKPVSTAGTANRAPAPPAPAPPPLVAPVCTPVACRPPQRFFRAAAAWGAVAAVLLLASLVFVIHETRPAPLGGRQGVNVVLGVTETPGRANAEWRNLVQAGLPAAVAQFLPHDGLVAETPRAEVRIARPQPGDQRPDGLSASTNVLVFQPDVEPPHVLSSNPYLDRSQAEDELMEQIAGYVVGALESQGLDVRGWTPNRLLLKKNLVRNATSECVYGPNNLEQCRVTMELDLSPTKIEQARQWLAADYSWVRTKGTAQAYAGAVMILGGLAICLRLGTSRRANE